MNKLQLTFLKIWSRCILHSFSSKDALSESPCNIWASKLWFRMAFCSSSARYSSFSLKKKKKSQINKPYFTHAFQKKWRNQHDHFRIMWGLRFTEQHPWSPLGCQTALNEKQLLTFWRYVLPLSSWSGSPVSVPGTCTEHNSLKW